MKPVVYRWGSVLAVGCLGIGLTLALHVPQTYSALFMRQAEIRALQRKNAELQQKNEEKRRRIRDLQDSAALQELEIRKRTKKLRSDEQTFVLQGDQSVK